ncbi:MAG: hypothetical protein ABIR11_00390 [Candidatus Limnocylindrales bacterium]
MTPPLPVAALGLVVFAVAGLAACAPIASPTLGPVASASILAPASGTPGFEVPPAVVSPVTGVPVHIEAEGFSKVTAFTIRTNDGVEIRFRMGILDNGDQFPPSHLAEHLSGSTPVIVSFRLDGADLVAYRIEDAPVR